jgi:hypothetical protein
MSSSLLKKGTIINYSYLPPISQRPHGTVNSLTNKKKCNHGISSIEIEGKTCNDGLVIANAFRAYFSTIAEKIPFNCSMNCHPAPDFANPINYVK